MHSQSAKSEHLQTNFTQLSFRPCTVMSPVSYNAVEVKMISAQIQLAQVHARGCYYIKIRARGALTAPPFRIAKEIDKRVGWADMAWARRVSGGQMRRTKPCMVKKCCLHI